MYCDFCGAKLPDDSTFCSECGARLAPLMRSNLPPLHDDNLAKAARKPENVPDVPPVPGSMAGKYQPAPVSLEEAATSSGGHFARTQTLTDAARLAIERNPAGKWTTWDDYNRIFAGAEKLLRLCGKEDRYLASTDDNEGIQYFVVSPDGAIGQVHFDDNDTYLILEWMYYTPSRAPEDLPQTPDEL